MRILYLLFFLFIYQILIGQVRQGWCLPYVGAQTVDVVPNHNGGDCDFGGHGPHVVVKVVLEIRDKSIEGDRKELWMVINFDATETTPDWTSTHIRQEYKIYTCEEYGYGIENICSDASSHLDYVDTNWDEDVFTFGEDEFVSKFIVKGDSRGDDVCNHTDDDVWMVFYTREVYLILSAM